MHLVIIGCGRTGSTLAARFDSEGDSVSVVDDDPQSRRRLPDEFGGEFIEGDGLDRQVLEAAGIEDAEALIAVSSSDATNVVVARAARDLFHVPHVVGRIDDPARAQFGVDLGLTMIATVRTTVDRVHRMLRHPRLEPERTFGNGETLLVRAPVPDYLAGRKVAELDVPGEIQAVEVSRGGHSTIPAGTATLQTGDVVSFVVAAASLGRLRSFLGGRWPQ
ncbi:MAG: NAD-binding protein [Actinomycetota bacterium]|nr:NAD-binding protein [Actinomycetota bacterium]